MRGLAASARLTKQYAVAIKHLERVLAISQVRAHAASDGNFCSFHTENTLQVMDPSVQVDLACQSCK